MRSILLTSELRSEQGLPQHETDHCKVAIYHSTILENYPTSSPTTERPWSRFEQHRANSYQNPTSFLRYQNIFQRKQHLSKSQTISAP